MTTSAPTLTAETIVTYNGETIGLYQLAARGFVIEHLSSDGMFVTALPANVLAQAYAMCDGFGDAPTYQDWSHVRDSSWATFVRVAEFLATKWALGTFAAIFQQRAEFYAQLWEMGSRLNVVDWFAFRREPKPVPAEGEGEDAPLMSKGHVAIIGAYEYFVLASTGDLYAAPLRHAVAPDGYRMGARWQAPRFMVEDILNQKRRAFGMAV